MDDLPPLDDASELVEKIKSRHAEKNSTENEISRELLNCEINDEKYIPKLITNDFQTPKPQNNHNSDKPAQKPVPAKKTTKKKPPKDAGFGGFQAGFLFGNKPKKQPAKKTAKVTEEIEEIITPKAKESIKKENPLILPEVQEQMKAELQDESFLASYETDAKLMKQMADPRFARAIEFMQRDPEGCKSYYMKHDPEFFKEFIEFFRQNMQRIAGHLEKKEVPEPNITERKSPEDIKMQSILERPEVKEAISNPVIVELFNELRTNPVRAQQKLSSLDPRSKSHIDILIRNGLLQMQS